MKPAWLISSCSGNSFAIRFYLRKAWRKYRPMFFHLPERLAHNPPRHPRFRTPTYRLTDFRAKRNCFTSRFAALVNTDRPF